MKRAAIICAVLLLASVLLSACNDEICPAYSQVDTPQVEKVV